MALRVVSSLGGDFTALWVPLQVPSPSGVSEPLGWAGCEEQAGEVCGLGMSPAVGWHGEVGTQTCRV